MPAPDAGAAINVLFIGNSLTYAVHARAGGIDYDIPAAQALLIQQSVREADTVMPD